MPSAAHAYFQASSKLEAFLTSEDGSSKTKRRVHESMKVLSEVYTRFPPEQLAFSFNGGKDCLVLLILVMAQLHKIGYSDSLKEVYVRPQDSFPEVDKFVEECRVRYPLQSEVYDAPMKSALSLFIKKHPEVSAIFVGTRRADPYSENLKFMQATDDGWPRFVRVHPMLDWEYDDIWNVLRGTHTPYCVLYDGGFTSIGGTSSTIPNPALREPSGDYKPAYELENFDLERAGRLKR